MSRLPSRWIGIALTVFALALPVHAQNVLTFRVENLESLFEDIDTIAVAFGQPEGSAEGLVQMAQGAIGMPTFDWVDRKNPLVFALPLEGLMLGEKGFVGALPVEDVDAAVEAMRAAIEGMEIDENGLIHVPTGQQSELVLLPSDGYMIFGQNPNLVGGFDPASLLAGAHLPPGTIAAEFNVDSMRAMIGMAVQGARQTITAAIAEGAGAENQAFDAESAAAMSDMMVGWIEALVANTRSVQLALEITGSHVIVHKHLLPVSGSTLDGFLRAQKGGMPELARMLDDEGSSMTMVANLTWTDESIAAMQGFMEGYVAMIGNMMADGADEMAGLGAFADLMPEMLAQYADMWKCMRGDMAQVMNMSDGLSFTQISGIRDTEDCRGLQQQVVDMVSALPEELEELFSVSPNGLSHRGVTALEYGLDLRKFVDLPGEEGAEEAMTMLDGLFGEDGFKSYMAVAGDYWLAAGGGAEADASMRQLIDRVKDKKKGDGIDAATFEPFTVGAGVYFMLDFGSLFEGISAALPEDADAAEVDQVREMLDAIGAITGGLDLQRDSLGVKFAMPTAGLSKIAEMAARED